MHTHNKSHKLFPVLGNQLGSSHSGGREVRLLLHTPDGALDSFGWLVSFVSLGSLVSTELVFSGLGRRMRCCLFLLNVLSSELTVKDCGATSSWTSASIFLSGTQTRSPDCDNSLAPWWESNFLFCLCLFFWSFVCTEVRSGTWGFQVVGTFGVERDCNRLVAVLNGKPVYRDL